MSLLLASSGMSKIALAITMSLSRQVSSYHGKNTQHRYTQYSLSLFYLHRFYLAISTSTHSNTHYIPPTKHNPRQTQTPSHDSGSKANYPISPSPYITSQMPTMHKHARNPLTVSKPKIPFAKIHRPDCENHLLETSCYIIYVSVKPCNIGEGTQTSETTLSNIHQQYLAPGAWHWRGCMTIGLTL